MTEPTQPLHDLVNPALLQLLPRDARVVLDVGCGAGALGAAYLPFNPTCRYLGLEIAPAAVTAARSRFRGVVEGDAEAVQLDELPLAAHEMIDVLIYGNVLEYLRNPWGTLTRHADWLARDGIVLACIPNVQHWSILANLLNGQWRLQNESFPDRAQLHFFTLDGILEMFAAAGMIVHEVMPRVLNPENFARFQQAVEPTLAALNIDRDRFAARANVLQYLVRAGRTPPPRRLCVNGLTRKPIAAFTDVRMNQPLGFLATIPGTQVNVQAVRPEGNAFPPCFGMDRILVWQRPLLIRPRDIQTVRHLLDRETLLVVEFDDNPQRWDEIAANDYLTFRGAHAIQTSTEPLAALLRQWNPEVAVFPNCVAALPPPRAPQRSSADETVIFFGALNRENDWAPILPALNEILAGPGGDKVWVEVVHDRLLFDALTTPRKRFTPTCPHARYLELLGGADIALLPLEDNPFNRMKSDLKFIEAAAHGVAVLASPVVYAHTVKPGETGLLYADPNEFSYGLRALIANTDLRRRLADAAYRYVAAERLLTQHYRRRLEWYRTLLANRQNLTAALRRRVPELA
jgi:SAM-dependent methyltransferase